MFDSPVNHPSYPVTLTDAEWGVVLAALYKAAMPMELTAPVVNKLQAAMAAAKAQKQESAP